MTNPSYIYQDRQGRTVKRELYKGQWITEEWHPPITGSPLAKKNSQSKNNSQLEAAAKAIMDFCERDLQLPYQPALEWLEPNGRTWGKFYPDVKPFCAIAIATNLTLDQALDTVAHEMHHFAQFLSTPQNFHRQSERAALQYGALFAKRYQVNFSVLDGRAYVSRR